tara:strand:- start:8078 stop:8617 length:540 start_codon:yes stop_codon:yes gene_type:complete
MRCFIALELSEEALSELEKIQQELKKKDLFTGTFPKKENIHLTLKFLGDVDEKTLKQTREALKNIKFSELQVSLKETGVFSGNFIRVIWVGLEGKGIKELQKTIDKELTPIFNKNNKFSTHITIARVKNIKDKKQLLDTINQIKPNKTSFKISKFTIKCSTLTPEGPVYKDIEEYPAKN